MSELEKSIKIFLDNPKDLDMRGVVERASDVWSVVQLYDKLKAKDEEIERLKGELKTETRNYKSECKENKELREAIGMFERGTLIIKASKPRANGDVKIYTRGQTGGDNPEGRWYNLRSAFDILHQRLFSWFEYEWCTAIELEIKAKTKGGQDE